MDHPFWRTGFVLTDPKDIDSIRTSAIKEVWIDSKKGLDVRAGEKVILETESEAQVDEEVSRVAKASLAVEQVTFAEELGRASKICSKAEQAVISMFREGRMGKAIDTQGVQRVVDEISASVARNPDALISLARLKTADSYTYMHSVAVSALMLALARQLNLDEQQTSLAGIGGLLHDMGKTFVPNEILNKPGQLTNEEFDVIKSHPETGFKALQKNPEINKAVLDIILHHHEKTDGSGYPDKLPEKEISVLARMSAICDVYDAITSNRPYKAGWDPAESLSRMAEWTDSHLDPRIFQAFVKSLGIYPIGSLVKLNTDRLGIVVGQSKKSLLTPVVKVFFSSRSKAHIKPEFIDLSRPGCRESIVSKEDPAKWNFMDIHEKVAYELIFGRD